MIRALILAASLGACAPTLTAQSVAPPGRAARLDEIRGFWGIKGYRMEVSQGVALAFTCSDGGPCEHLTVTSDNPGIAEIRAASLGRLERQGFANNATAAASIVVGKAPGATVVHVRSKDGDRDVPVIVIPQPAPAQVVGARP